MAGLNIDSTTAQDLLASNCTTCTVTLDRSGYWTPALYFQHENGSFELLTTAGSLTVYYKLEKRINFENENYTVWPQGFRMLAGSNEKRTWTGPWPVPPQSVWGPSDTTQAALAEKSIGFNCLNYVDPDRTEGTFAYPWLRSKQFFDQNCPDGLRAEVLFPSCWDGVNLDSRDHKSHVAYPTLLQNGACPNTHNVYLPVIFYETIWNTQAFMNISGRFVFANGDPTGFGYHGDFLAVWPNGILNQIQQSPQCTDQNQLIPISNGDMIDCPVISPFLQSDEDMADCILAAPKILRHEKVTGLLNHLPGSVNVIGERCEPWMCGNKGSLEIHTGIEGYSTVAADTVSSHTRDMTGALQPSSSFTTTVSTLATPTAQDGLWAITTSTYTVDQELIEAIVEVEITRTTVTVAGVASRHSHGHKHS